MNKVTVVNEDDRAVRVGGDEVQEYRIFKELALFYVKSQAADLATTAGDLQENWRTHLRELGDGGLLLCAAGASLHSMGLVDAQKLCVSFPVLKRTCEEVVAELRKPGNESLLETYSRRRDGLMSSKKKVSSEATMAAAQKPATPKADYGTDFWTPVPRPGRKVVDNRE